MKIFMRNSHSNEEDVVGEVDGSVHGLGVVVGVLLAGCEGGELVVSHGGQVIVLAAQDQRVVDVLDREELGVRLVLVLGDGARVPAVWPVGFLAHDFEVHRIVAAREDDDHVVGRSVFDEAKSPDLRVSPPRLPSHEAMEEEHGLAVIASLASMWNVDVSDLIHIGTWVLFDKRSLVECMEISELRVVHLPVFHGIMRLIEQGVEKVVGQVVSAILDSTQVRCLLFQCLRS